MIDRLTSRVALLLVVCVVLVVVLVGWFGFVSPQRSKAASLETQIGDTQVQVASTEAYMHSPAVHRSAAELRRLRKADPADVRMSEIVRQLSAAAGRAGVSINGITPSALVPSAGGQAIPISLTIEGHYFGLASFLHLLRTRAIANGKTVHASGRLYSVDQIQFSGGVGQSVISATVSLNAFISAPAAALPVTTADETTTTTSGQ
jgi:hypothetical protein